MTITPTQLDEAEAIARAATQGEWVADLEDGVIEAASGGTVASIARHGWQRTIDRAGQEFSHADAAHIAHFSPAFALELIERIRSLQAAYESFRGIRDERDEARADCDELRVEVARYREALDRVKTALLREPFQHGDIEHRAWLTTHVELIFAAALDAKTEGGGDVESK
jgi:hypothetical protein